MEISLVIFLGLAMLTMDGLACYYGYSIAQKSLERITARSAKLRKQNAVLKENVAKANYQISELKKSNAFLNTENYKLKNRREIPLKNSIHQISDQKLDVIKR